VTGALKVLLADRAPTRLGMRMALGEEVEVCAEAGDSEQAIRLAKRAQPDVCLIGPGIAGVAGTVMGISRAAPSAAVIVLSQEGDVEELVDVVRAGAVGYVPDPPDAQGLRKVVRAISEGQAVVPRSMVLELILELRTVGIGGDTLPARGSQVLGMLRRGHTTNQIAERLEIAPVTVRRHISELVHKLGVEDRAALTESVSSRWSERLSAGDDVHKT
jgi:NarL family two-component system response regulator LiaR